MSESVLVTIDEPTDVAQVRRTAASLAHTLAFDEVRAGEVAIVATEASTNMLKHAGRGDILLRIVDDEPGRSRQLELLALDQGPGMSDVERCMSDGFSTGSSPGQGMGAIRRLSSESDFYSIPGVGTAVLARWFSNSRPEELRGNRFHAGAVNLMKKGQEVCGDSWGIEQTDEVTTILVADGLGHGYDAHVASMEAVRMLHNNPDATPQALLQLVHQALRSSRGAAVAIARIDKIHGQLTFAGVGNIMGQIYAGALPGQHLVSVNGTAGHQTLRLRESACPWPESGTLVLYSDGLTTGTSLHARPKLAFHDPSLIAGVLYRDFTRGLDDATVIVARVK